MKKNIDESLNEINNFVPIDLTDLENFRIKFFGKKGVLKDFSELLKLLPQEEKKEFGQSLNLLRERSTEKLLHFKDLFSIASTTVDKNVDFTRPAQLGQTGARHPLSIVKNKIIDIFSRIGFTISEGPEIEDDWHNFSALNFPSEHPAKDMQDTFFIEKNPDFSLRTHTSSVQVRVMENSTPPIRSISPGRVFRNEAVSARAHCIFHQIEGLYIDKNVSFSDLKQVLLFFAKEFFGETTQIRLRPSYFPFTEPSFEMDVYWGLKSDVDYRITKGTGWLEILGCGMVDPEVLKNCKIDPSIYSGFAFGMGLERITMLQYQIGDLRMFFENDSRFLKQFSTSII